MRETEQRQRKRRQGFTLAELLVVVAIITILAGVSFVAVIRYQSRLKRLEMDQTAKEIFLAAQNRLSLEESQGTFERLLKGGEDENKLGIKVPSGNSGTGSGEFAEGGAKDLYCILYAGEDADPTAEIRNRLLPFGSIDETVRTDGSYLIFYEPETGAVRGVWYSDRYRFERDDIGSAALSEAAGSAEKREHFQGAGVPATEKGPAVGYYGGENAGSIDGETSADLEPVTFELRNDSALYAYVRDPNLYTTKTYGLKLYLEGVTSGTKCEVDMKKKHVRQSKMLATGTDETSGTYRWILDDVTSSGLRFADLNQSDLQDAVHFTGTERFLPGEDIRAYVCVFASGSSRPVQTTPVQQTNSLFQSVKEDRVTISNIRHLENLDFRISKFRPARDGAKLGLSAVGEDAQDLRYAAVQQKDLSWSVFRSDISEIHSGFTGLETDANKVSVWHLTSSGEEENEKTEEAKTADGCFAPVNAQFPLIYDGNFFAIDEIRVNTADPAGIFGNVKKNMTIRQLTVRKPEVVSTGIASAGALIGSAEKGTDVSLLVQDVVIQYPSVQALGRKNATSTSQVDAGGVIGSFEGKSLELTDVLVEDSFRTEVVKRQTQSGKALPEELSEEEHHALRIYAKYGSAGGLIGSMASGSLEVSESSASVYVDARDYAGGLFGSVTSSGGSSSAKVDACYVGAHTYEGKMQKTTPPATKDDAAGDESERAFCAVKGRYNIVSRIKQAGGLAGVFPENGVIAHSYVTASVYSFGDTNSGETEWGAEPEADQSQKEAAFIGIFGKPNQDGITGTSGKAASDFSYCYSSVIINGARAAVYSPELSGEFSSKTARSGRAFPYDSKLAETYPMMTVLELLKKDPSVTAKTRDDLSKYMRVHIGDWLEMTSKEPVPVPTPDGTSISDGNRLYVERVIDVPTDDNTYLTFSVTGLTSGRSVYYVANPRVNGEDTSASRFTMRTDEKLNELNATDLPGGEGWDTEAQNLEKRVEFKLTPDGKLNVRFYIDNLSVPSGGFQALWSKNNGGNLMVMTAGENIEIGVCDGIRVPNEKERVTKNSMFQEIEDNGDGTYTAYISNARHLENLNFFGNSEWSKNKLKITKAVQKEDIFWQADPTIEDASEGAETPYCEEMESAYQSQWNIYNGTTDVAKSGSFCPINNPELEYYDGGNHRIIKLTVDRNNSDGASLFVGGSSMTIEKLKMKDPKMITTKGGNAAVLLQKVGEEWNADGTLTLRNITIYGDITVIAKAGWNAAAGSLVGSANVTKAEIEHVTVSGEHALIGKVFGGDKEAGGSAGGLIGGLNVKASQDAGTFRMDNCVYSGYVLGAKQDEKASGGLIGSLTASSGTITNSYVAGRNADYAYISQYGGETGILTGGVNIAGRTVVGGLIGKVKGSVTISHCFSTAGIKEYSYSGYSSGTGGLIGVIDAGTTKGVNLISCYFAGNINGYGSLKKIGTATSSQWANNTGILAGSVTAGADGQSALTMDEACTYLQLSGFSGKPLIGNINRTWPDKAADPANPDSMGKIRRPGTLAVQTERYDQTLPESYPYQTWTTDQKGNYTYYGDWPDWTKLQ